MSQGTETIKITKIEPIIAAAAPNLAWGVSPTAPYLAVDIVRNPIEVRGGHVEAPAGAVLGVEVDEEALAQYALAKR